VWRRLISDVGARPVWQEGNAARPPPDLDLLTSLWAAASPRLQSPHLPEVVKDQFAVGREHHTLGSRPVGIVFSTWPLVHVHKAEADASSLEMYSTLPSRDIATVPDRSARGFTQHLVSVRCRKTPMPSALLSGGAGCSHPLPEGRTASRSEPQDEACHPRWDGSPGRACQRQWSASASIFTGSIDRQVARAFIAHNRTR